MSKIEEKVTLEQQTAIDLDNKFCRIQLHAEWILQLSNEICEFFWVTNIKQYFFDTSKSPEERLIEISKILWDYDNYRIYAEILEHLIFELKEMVDSIS